MKAFPLSLALAAAIGTGAAGAANPQVVFETTAGDIRIELFQDDAPVTVENFLG